MCAAALQQIQLNTANLGVGLFFDDLSQNGGQSAHLRVAKAISLSNLGLGHKTAVGIVDALRHSYQAVTFFGIDTLDVLDKLCHIKIGLRQINEVGACAVFAGQSGGGGQPARVTAHDFHYDNHTGIVYMGIKIYLHERGGDIFGGRSVAGAVIGAEEVVINGLWHAHYTALIAHRLHILVDLIAGIHGVVTTVIKEIPDIILLEDLQNLLVIRVVHGGISQLVAAGSKGRGGGVFQQTQFLGILQSHIKQTIIQNALDAVLSTQNAGNNSAFQRGINHAVCTGVDDGCGATGLPDDTGSF